MPLLLLPLALVATACEEWLDVKPKAQIEADVLYGREPGFKDVLYNAYINMIAPAMYGSELTFGMVDVLGNVYPAMVQTADLEARAGNYAHSVLEPRIDAIWQTGYNTIANLNNLIEHLRVADQTLFSPDNYNVILGEALGLRAFLHFDLLRLFAPSPASDPGAMAIPYVTRYGFNITPEYTVSAVTDSILVDLQAAATLLRESDPIVTGRVITATTDDGYLLKRPFRLNYYAVIATMARVYLYRGDLAAAAARADEVIASGRFRWTSDDEMVGVPETRRDQGFSQEQVLVLHVPRIAEYTGNPLREDYGNISGRQLRFRDADVTALYPSETDWRKLFAWTPQASTGVNAGLRSNLKLSQPEGLLDSLACRVPLIRLPELYLISAEASLDTDPEKARERVNELRRHRECNLDIPAGTPPDVTRAEILQEYRREFIGEGILFFYYKRLDAAQLEGSGGGVFDKTKYVLPVPVEEIEFGNRF